MRTLLVASIVTLLALLACAPPAAETAEQVCIETACFSVEVVSAPEERARGLMFRESLAPDAGMLFVFEQEGVYPFWMKNTLIPLDIIWINAGREIVSISEETPPCEADPCPWYNPGAAARYVLEISGGEAGARGLAVGDKAAFTLTVSPR